MDSILLLVSAADSFVEFVLLPEFEYLAILNPDFLS